MLAASITQRQGEIGLTAITAVATNARTEPTLAMLQPLRRGKLNYILIQQGTKELQVRPSIPTALLRGFVRD